jgi:GT2 family glycosyltransferase
MNSIDLSIVIVTYKTREVTLDCIRSIYDSITKYKFEVIVVDNLSEDNTIEEIKNKFPDVFLIASKQNVGFSKGNNLGIKQCSGNYIMLLNSDTILFENSIENLIESTIFHSYKICGPKLLNKNETIQRSWFNFPSSIKIFLRLTEIYTIFYKLSEFKVFKLFFSKSKLAFMLDDIVVNTKMNYLSFACILISREVLNKIGLLDEGLAFYHEDCEYGIRASKAGFDTIYNIESKIIHLGGTSSSGSSLFAFENDVKGLLHVYKKHYSVKDFRILKKSIYLALTWRMFFWHFGFYKTLKKIGIYNQMTKTETKHMQDELFNKYKYLRKVSVDFN